MGYELEIRNDNTPIFFSPKLTAEEGREKSVQS